MAFDPVEAILALKAHELRLLLEDNPMLVGALKESDVLRARLRGAMKRSDISLDAYLEKARTADALMAESQKRPAKYSAALAAGVAREKAFAAHRRFEARHNRLFAELQAAYAREATERASRWTVVL